MPKTQSLDTDHVVMLEKVDKMILHAEKLEVDQGLRRRMYALRNLLVIHSSKAQNVKDEIENILNFHRKKILIIGFTIGTIIIVPYYFLNKTSFFLGNSLFCKTFYSAEIQDTNKIEVCINGISEPYSPENGDVELDISFMRTATQKVQADVIFWIADYIADKKVDYSGEYNTERVRIYDNNILIEDIKQKSSSWVKPLVPKDVRMDLWKYVYSLKHVLDIDKKPLAEKIENLLIDLGAIIASLSSVGIAIYRFFRTAT